MDPDLEGERITLADTHEHPRYVAGRNTNACAASLSHLVGLREGYRAVGSINQSGISIFEIPSVRLWSFFALYDAEGSFFALHDFGGRIQIENSDLPLKGLVAATRPSPDIADVVCEQ